MGSRRGMMKKLREHEVVLLVPKGSNSLTPDQIREFFEQERRMKQATKEAK